MPATCGNLCLKSTVVWIWFYLFPALHHNNCMYVAHNIQTIEKQFCKKLAQCPLPDRHAKLSDLVPRVRKLGNGNFTQHIVLKKEQICDYLILAEGTFTSGCAQYLVNTIP